MALNIKGFLPLDHPPVSFPEKPPKLSASNNTDNGDLEKENLKEKAMDMQVKRIYLEDKINQLDRL